MKDISFNGNLGIEVLVYRCLGCGCRVNWIEQHTGCDKWGRTLAPEGCLVAAGEKPESEASYGDMDKLAGDVERMGQGQVGTE